MNETVKQSGEWNYFVVLLAAVVGFYVGPPITGKVASRDAAFVFTEFYIGWLVLAFNIYVPIRTLVARLRRERNRTWKAYAVLALFSSIWIRWLVELVFFRFAS